MATPILLPLALLVPLAQLPHARKIQAAVSGAHDAVGAPASRSGAKVAIIANESVSSY